MRRSPAKRLGWCGAVLVLFPLLGNVRPAAGLPLYAVRERLSCSSCHVDPSGGGPRNAYGFDYMLARHATTPEFKWPELPEAQPELAPGLAAGADLRAIYDARNARHVEGFPDQASSFVRMQSALYLTYAPLEPLVLALNADIDQGRLGGPEWFAMGHQPDGPLYVKFGAFRVPYGLRMDDHTLWVRNDWVTHTLAPRRFELLGRGGDPRLPDVGIELGAQRRRAFAQLALTNGATGALDIADRNLAVTARAGGALRDLWGGVTTHLDTDGEPGAAGAVQVRRYGVFGGVRAHGRWVFLGEASLGEDRPLGTHTIQRLIASWAEADFLWSRGARARFRYDYVNSDRDLEFAAAERYTAEVDWTPTPFTTLRWSYRFTSSEFGPDLDEFVFLGHFHF